MDQIYKLINRRIDVNSVIPVCCEANRKLVPIAVYGSGTMTSTLNDLVVVAQCALSPANVDVLGIETPVVAVGAVQS